MFLFPYNGKDSRQIKERGAAMEPGFLLLMDTGVAAMTYVACENPRGSYMWGPAVLATVPNCEDHGFDTQCKSTTEEMSNALYILCGR
jgi:hypothetical protein